MPNPRIPDPPIFLLKVPKSLIRQLDVGEVLRDALTAIKHIATYGPVIAFYSTEAALAAARRQQRRIARAKVAAWKPTRSRSSNAILFADVHFYVICWARIAKLMRFVAHSTKFQRVGLVLRRYHADLDKMIDLRDQLEHFEERLPGGKRQHKLQVPNDLFNIANQYATFGGRKFDIGPDSVSLLMSIVEEFRKAVLYDALEVLATADSKRVSFLFQRASSDVDVARMNKRIEKLLRQSLTPPSEP